MKANHNYHSKTFPNPKAVSSYAKLLKWKQITTNLRNCHYKYGCKFLCKVTKMKANHNSGESDKNYAKAVSSYAKLLKWKQITTNGIRWCTGISCKFLCKVTKMKANHNMLHQPLQVLFAVSSYAKLLKWKQITTTYAKKVFDFRL